MRKQTYGDKQHDAQQQKRQEELRAKFALKPKADVTGEAAKKTPQTPKTKKPAGRA
jgi:hypothetical protein